MKENLLISFSGGETSGYMLYYLTNEWKDRHNYNIVVVFANTGEEDEETLLFVKACGELFDVDIVWLEANVVFEKRKGTTHKIVDFETASRNGEPFEDVIKKYSIPNKAFPHCNRELKLRPIHSYIKRELGWKNYYTAIGIRYDEVDRMSPDRKKNKIIYPLIEYKRMTKSKVNYWWSHKPFRLNLTGYQGNYKTCWKKSFRNLYTIYNENPEYFNFNKRMEDKYGEGKFVFFRGNKSVYELIEEAKNFNGKALDTNQNSNFQFDLFDLIDEVESCDIYSNCGDL